MAVVVWEKRDHSNHPNPNVTQESGRNSNGEINTHFLTLAAYKTLHLFFETDTGRAKKSEFSSICTLF